MNKQAKGYHWDWYNITLLDAKTGAVLAASSKPSFDPNKRDIKNYMDMLLASPYEPGSTMKTFTYMAALETGKYDGIEVYIYGDDIIDGYLPVKFGRIAQQFVIDCCRLNSLEGCPEYVGGDFKIKDCSGIDDLRGMTQNIEGNLTIEHFHYPGLKSFEGFPQNVGKNINLIEISGVENLKGLPEKVYGNLYMQHLFTFKSFEGCPEYVKGNFTYVWSGRVDDLLTFGPKEVGGEIDIPSYNGSSYRIIKKFKEKVKKYI